MLLLQDMRIFITNQEVTMMKKFEKPEMEIMMFNVIDVLTTVSDPSTSFPSTIDEDEGDIV